MPATRQTAGHPPVTAAAHGWVVRQYLLLLVSAAAMLWLFEASDLDRQLAHLFFDGELGLFPLRRLWLFEQVLHRGMKQVTYLAVAAALYVCHRGWRGQLAWLPPRNALLAASGMLLIPLSVALLKQFTSRYCPWDMVEFGGYAPYLGLLTAAPECIKAGQCFPAGHASTGFLWLVWGVALRPAGRRLARRGLLAGLLVGGLLGTARMAQGAHFLSHTLWTLWFAWALSLTLALLLKADVRMGSGADLRLPVPHAADVSNGAMTVRPVSWCHCGERCAHAQQGDGAVGPQTEAQGHQ